MPRLWPSIVDDCKRYGIDLTPKGCEITFSSTGNVESFGDVERGEFEADSDIAGKGVLIALAVPTYVICFLGLVFAGLRGLSFLLHWQKGQLKDYGANDGAIRFAKKLHDVVDGFALSTVDAQLYLLLAFGVSFRLQSMCSLSIYHLNIAVHVGTMGLATVALTLVLVPNFGGKKLNTVVRAILLAVCAVGFLSFVVDYRSARIGAVQLNLPAAGQADSLILLPAFCLLEEGFNPFPDLSTAQQVHLLNNGPLTDLNAQVSLAGLSVVIAVVISLFVNLLTLSDGVKTRMAEQGVGPLYGSGRGPGTWLLLGAKFIVWLFCLIVIVWNSFAIWTLRKWVNDSGWLAMEGGRNSEDQIQGIGQLAPLFALGAVVAVVLEGIPLGKKKPDEPPTYENAVLQDLT